MKTYERREAIAPAGASPKDPPKRPFVEPKLSFVEPKLVCHGSLADVTAGFFGIFSP